MYQADTSPLSSSPGYPWPISEPLNERRSASRTIFCDLAGAPTALYMNGMWWLTWLLTPHCPKRPSRASTSSWIGPSEVSGLAKNSSSLSSMPARPP